MVLTFDKQINLTTYADNPDPKVVSQLSIVHEAFDGEIVQYYIDKLQFSEADKASTALSEKHLREGSSEYDEDPEVYYTYTDYDTLIWKAPKARITRQRIDRLGLKAFPGVGAIAHYKLAYQNISKVVAPVNKRTQLQRAPELSATVNGDNSVTFTISVPDTAPDYKFYRLVCQLDWNRLEYVTCERSITIPQVPTSGTYLCYCIGYVDEGQVHSYDSNALELQLIGQYPTWPVVTPGSEDVYLAELHFNTLGYLEGTLSNGTIVRSDNPAPSGGGGGGGVTDYDDLDNRPSINGNLLTGNKTNAQLGIPSKTSDLANDSGFVADPDYVHTDNNYSDTDKYKLAGLQNYTLPMASANTMGGVKVGDGLSIDANGVLKANGVSNYNDLTNQPSINGHVLTGNQTNAQLGIPSKTSDLTNDSAFVADPSYVHTDNNYTTAEKNKVANIPTKTSDLTNDSNFVSDASYVHTDNNYTTADKNKVANIPTKTSDLTNDSNFASDANYVHTDNNYTTADKNKVANIPSRTSDLTNDTHFVSDASYVHTDNNYTTAEKNKLADLQNYVLPTASPTIKGGVKVGTGLSIDNDGVLSATGGGGGGGGMSAQTSTLLAANWTGSTAPYEYDLGNTYANVDVVIGYDASSVDSTPEKMTAAAKAKIVGGDSTILFAYGRKPTVDIPVIIIYG